MKKLTLIYLGILAAVYIVFSVLGMRDDYAIEQKLWKIHQKYTEITKDPSVVPEQNFIDVAEAYEKITQQYPKSKLMQGVHLLVGDVYMLKKDYTKARAKFEQVRSLYPDKTDLLADATSRVGKTYELEGDWPKALAIYQDILKRWPDTTIGLGIPLYIANYYKAKNDFQNTMSAYTEAVAYYKGVAEKDSSSLTGFNARRLVATCYLDIGRWREGVDALASLLDTYASSTHLTMPRADSIIKTINVVAAFQLDNYDIARNVYKDFTTRHPQHPLSAYLQRMIEAFNELDAKGVRVTNQPPQQ